MRNLMPKANKQRLSSNFMQAGPLKTAAVLLLAISVLVNLGTLLFFVLLHQTPHYNTDLYRYTREKICVTDYADMTAADQKAYETFCK